MLVGEALLRAQRALAALSETPASDARLLLADVLRKPTTWVLAHEKALLDEGLTRKLEASLSRCLDGEPLPYVLGRWEFYGRSFRLDRRALIPRPETELMVEGALAELRRRPRRAIDLGTGSGCVAITLAAEVEGSILVAADVSRPALELARENAGIYGVAGRIRFVQSHLLEGLGQSWDLICANLPYLPSERLGRLPVAAHEPRLALDGGPRGTELTGSLVRSLGRALARGGVAFIEIDEGQAAELVEAARRAVPDGTTEVRRDLAGWERLIVVRRGPD